MSTENKSNSILVQQKQIAGKLLPICIYIMSSTIPISSSRTTQSMVAIGSLIIAAATSTYIIHRASRSKRPPPSQSASSDEHHQNDKNVSSTTDDESNYYKQLGISEDNLPEHIQREIHKERKRKEKVELISMKTPMYDNVYMLDKDKEPMCTISMKKARWYVRKDIAEWSSFKNGEHMDHFGVKQGDDVKCIRLLFEHNGAGSEKEKGTSPETLYLRSAKANICVACGDDGHHIRHYIVPFSYRTLFPDQYKSHMSHDIVILCPDCHLDCERHSKPRMKAMETDLRMKMGGESVRPVIEDPHLGHIRSCAIALVKWKDNMPTEKVERYETDVREYLASSIQKEEDKEAMLNGTEELTKSQLQTACSVNYRVKNPNFVPGSEIVVQSLKDDARVIEEFIIDWRKHFLATVNPRFMPTGWRVDNPVVCGSRTDGDTADGVKSW